MSNDVTSNEVTNQLPIAAVARDVCKKLHAGNVVLQAEPGAGKSTGLPLTLLTSGFAGKLLLLEPRRLAAFNVATRLASQLDESVGGTVGLRMRGSTKVSAGTRLEVVTEGVLTRILQDDPLLDGISVVIFDEFHERSLHADLGLALCLDVQRNLREDLRLLLMSATLDGEQLCEHIGVDAPVVCSVRQHPVEIVWCGESRDPIERVVCRVALQALLEHEGDMLVFLPGVAEIEKTARLLEQRLPEGVVLHRLHGRVSNQQQRAATAPRGSRDSGSREVERRVILSTSIAETSITIDGVRIVVDSGVERRARMDNTSGTERLETVMASQASATQRAGRAGRTEPGVCYRLWSEEGHGRRAPRWQPELFRADLSPVLVEVAQWGASNINELPWIDAPLDGACQRAGKLLGRLGVWHQPVPVAEPVIDSQLDHAHGSGLTEYGRAVARLPVHPRLGHMLLWASQHGAAKLACTLAVLLEDRPQHRGVDLFASISASANSSRAGQLFKLLPRNSKVAAQLPSAAVLLAQAYPDRVAKRRDGIDARYQVSSGAGAVLDIEDSLAQSQWLVIAEMGGTGREMRVFSALSIELEELLHWCGNLIESCERVEWDDKAERVVAQTQLTIGSIVLESKPVEKVNAQQRADALISAVQRKGLSCLNFTDDIREWCARVSRMRILEGENTDYPSVDDNELLSSVAQWLAPWIGNRNTLQSLQQIELMPVLASMLSYQQQQKLDAWFPQKYKVPSGSQHKLRYACDGSPVLAVKLQEMFGCRENPSIAEGRILLKVELLSPARRPVQITEDLANFWHNSYPAVKKDLAGRYPKHPWPDDPLTAVATARAKPRKK